MSNLVIGINVKIQRTNGQIHMAQVTSVSHDSKTVTVEWPEGEEIKGKELNNLGDENISMLPVRNSCDISCKRVTKNAAD
ncbi:hypothetical protein NH340_JMT04378 [Sarcoptes scabiei]|nr:hypothetical protein NH340_JMT04378 [Sarcoptes scabiei]